jgi:repressor LexA
MNRIKEVLESKGIKQKWLSDKMGKSFNMVNSYVQNRRQPSLKDLFKIAQILDVGVTELLINSKKSKNSSSEANMDYTTTVKIPLLGSVSCGHPFLAEENIESTISVSSKLIKKNKNYFILRASGDSMNMANINNGDLVLIRQEQTAENGDKVVALINDEATIKKFDKQGNIIVLRPMSDNVRHQPIILREDFKIQGIVENVITN